MSKIIQFTGMTKLDINPETMLENTKKEDLDGIVILGYTKKGEKYFASSYADLETVNWLLDSSKIDLFNMETGRE